MKLVRITIDRTSDPQEVAQEARRRLGRALAACPDAGEVLDRIADVAATMRRTATSLSEVGAQAMIRQVVEHDNVRVELQLRGQRRGLIARLCGGSR